MPSCVCRQISLYFHADVSRYPVKAFVFLMPRHLVVKFWSDGGSLLVFLRMRCIYLEKLLSKIKQKRTSVGMEAKRDFDLIVGGFYSEVALQKREAEGTVRTNL